LVRNFPVIVCRDGEFSQWKEGDGKACAFRLYHRAKQEYKNENEGKADGDIDPQGQGAYGLGRRLERFGRGVEGIGAAAHGAAPAELLDPARVTAFGTLDRREETPTVRTDDGVAADFPAAVLTVIP
jgi:hypothetical protein